MSAGRILSIRVFYEDTDAGGIVYYANYLRFLERGRTELLRALGWSQQALLGENVAFAVRSAQIEYLKPARLDDLLEVETRIAEVGRAQACFSQCIRRAGHVLVDARIRVACIAPLHGKPIALPEAMRTQLLALLEPSA